MPPRVSVKCSNIGDFDTLSSLNVSKQGASELDDDKITVESNADSVLVSYNGKASSVFTLPFFGESLLVAERPYRRQAAEGHLGEVLEDWRLRHAVESKREQAQGASSR